MTYMDSRKSRRLFGVEDGSFHTFNKNGPSFAFFCGVETESIQIVGVSLTKIQIDGLDATKKLLGIMEGVDVEAVILGGITFAGFNIVNPWSILEKAGTPVVVYSGVKPDNDRMLSALKGHFEDWRDRWEIVDSLGPVYSVRSHPNEPPIYFEVVGGSLEWAEDLLSCSAVVSRIPEPVRVAGLIARGLSPSS